MKKSQHYVWKYYLKRWTNHDKIWCKRNNKIFNTSLDNIAHENYFNVLENINEEELGIVIGFLNKIDETAKPIMEGNIQILLNASKLKGKNKIEYLENYHTFIENTGRPLLESLYSENTDFLSNQRNKDHFSYYLGLQYTRTKKIRQSLIKNFETDLKETYKNKINIETISHSFAFLSADFIGNWISSEGNFTLLKNNTEVDFITSDQPIYNHSSNYENLGTSDQMELFYPITPRLAVFISNKKIENFYASTNLIEYYNNKIISEAEEFLFATNESQLK